MSSSVSWESISSSLSSLMLTHLKAPIQSAFTRADDVLFNLSEDGTKQEYLDALRYIRQERERLLSSWERYLQSSMDEWTKYKEVDFSKLELSLVSDEELEEKLAINQMCESFYKTGTKYFNILDPVWEEVSQDLNENKNLNTKPEKFPLSSLGLSCLIGDWFKDIELDFKIRVVFLKILERETNQALPSFLPKVIDLLKKFDLVKDTKQSTLSHSSQNTKQNISSNQRQEQLSNQTNNDNLNQENKNHNLFDDNTIPLKPYIPPTPLMSDDVDNTHTIYDSGVSNNALNLNQEILKQQSILNDYPPITSLPPKGAPFSQANARLFAMTLNKLLGSSLVKQSLSNSSDDYDDFDDHHNQDGNDYDNFDNFSEDDWDPAIFDLVSLLDSRRRNARRQNSSHQSLPVLPSKVVRSVLNDLQSSLPQSVKEAARTNDKSLSQQFKNEMLIRAQQLGVSEKEARLNDQDEDTVDIVGMLFEMFLSERHLREDMREDISRLLAPYVKVAMADRKLFMHRHHPARKLLDAVAEVVEGNMGENAQEKEALSKISSAIDKLVSQYNEDIAIFEMIEAEVREFVDQQKIRIELAEKRAAEAQKGKEKLELSKAISQERFKEKVKDINWPVKTMELLRNYWTQHYMIMMLRAPEGQSEDENESLKSANLLLDDLIEIGTYGVSKTAHKAKEAHPQVIEMLSSSGVTENAAQEVAMDIWSALDQSSRWMGLHQGYSAKPIHDDNSSKDNSDNSKGEDKDNGNDGHEGVAEDRNNVNNLEDENNQDNKPQWVKDKIKSSDKIVIPTSYVTDKSIRGELKYNFSDPNDSGGEIVITGLDVDELTAYFENMPDGSWIEFVKVDGSITAAKKSWVSPISGRILFVNRKGARLAVESPYDLAVKVRLGQVRLRTVGVGEKGFDRSYQKAINTLSSVEE